MKGRFTGLLFLAIMFVNLCICTCANADSRFIIRNIISDKSGSLIAITGSGNQNSEIKISRLNSPDRLIVDVNNSMLIGQKKSLNINNTSIKTLRIAQFSTNPDIVRLVLTADSADSLKKIKVSRSKNIILLGLNELKTARASENPLYKDREDIKPHEETISQDLNRIEPITINADHSGISQDLSPSDKESILKSLQDRIDHNIVLKVVRNSENRVIISGTGILSITEPILLENPRRLVFDIPDGIVSSEDLLIPVSLKNGDVIRLGQFDTNTVRVVIETKDPEKYKTLISPDMQSLIISPEKEISFEEFPDSDSKGRIQDIKIIKKDSLTTYMLLTAEKPFIHDIKRVTSPENKLILELFNLKRPSKELIVNLEDTGQFHGIHFEHLENFAHGSKWTFLLNKTTKVESKLSLDGRMLEIALKDVIPVAVCKPKTRGKIVIDAGHGGQEPGAVKADIYEKDITIKMAHKVKEYLQDAGYKVVMTREADENVSLKQRTDITNAENPNVFVSIHVNSSESPNLTGLETYYYTSQSKELAKSVHTKLINYVNSKDNGIRTARFYVIRNTEVPAILVETGYMSNNAERADIITENRINLTAKAITDGIINYLKSK